MILDRTYSMIRRIPFGCAQTEIQRGDAIVLASVYLPAGKRLSMKFAQLHIVNLPPRSDAGNTQTLSRVAHAQDACYMAMFPAVNQVRQPLGVPLWYCGLDAVGSATTDVSNRVDIAVPGHYGVLLVNNTHTHNFSVVATGCLSIS